MAPKSSQSSQGLSQRSKQQTISSFFTPKPSQTPKAPPKPAALAVPNVADQDDDDEDEDIAPPRQLTPARKRSIDEQHEDEEAGRSSPPKRVRVANDEPRPSLGNASATTLNAAKPPKITERTSKFLFSSSPVVRDETDAKDDAAATQKLREKLHEKFVKKLGRPDSFAELRRRNKVISEDNGNGEEGEGEEDEEEEEPAPKSTKGRKGATTKKASKLTPMELQYLDIKRKHLDTVIVMEVGYKFKFFGEDARTASKELGIVCIPGKFRYDEHPSEAHYDRFASASFPVHRLQVHVKRLVKANHKVGVVRQLETAALKAAGNNRNTPFVRKLTNLYTKGTYVDDIEGLETPTAGAQATGYLLCVTETNAKGWGTDEKVQVGLVAVQPATGDIIYDDFEDGFMRSEIETRLLHIAPAEFLIVGDLSKATDKLIQHLSASKTNVFGDRSRVERVEKPKTMAAQAYSHISNFYADKMKSGQEGGSEQGAILDKVHQLSEHVTICLSAMITYLSDYGLEHVFDLTKYFQPFSARSYMLLNGNTLSSLEIYQNQTDYTSKGSLFWTMDRTKTRFGQRLLRKWVGRPLIDKERLEERIAAVEELKEGEHTIAVDKVKFLLGKIKTDLEKVLIRIYYKKCSRPELLAALQILQDIASQYLSAKTPEQSGFSSILLSEAVSNVPKIYEDVNSFLEKINAKAAKDDDKYGFFREEFEAEDINDLKLSIASVEDDLNTHRKDAAAKLGKTKVDFVTVAGIEYLIEVKRKSVEEKKVPASWQQISATKTTLRFHTPEVKRMLQERDQYKESLAAACDTAFKRLLDDIAAKYQSLRDCVSSLATLDALLSLATLANQPGYVKPTFVETTELDIVGGRHPMVEQLLLDAYVPNDLHLSGDATRALLVTGPNMGGKSSYVRSAALIAIMGQIGSYVPAESAKLDMLDAVFTRMGALDNMLKGESTFMVELNETADILRSATSRSLIILDELGRGTSTFDGVAIAEAVLDYVIRDVGALTLFITHYQHLARLQDRFNGELKNVHMSFEERDGGKEVVFLYEVAEGTSHRSYGLNVARLAKVPERVIETAEVKSSELEESMGISRVANMARMVKGLLEDGGEEGLERLIEGIEQL
ncbi:DNA mismatch repair protein MSH3 [Parastagonospora nodorum]|nr:DNA mismatch repair protein MSH3 [Parastagonospora nodorum]KAH5108997.1 DNA mismatch repair protein MSH3 [Parastagonospora nodorum]KAH5135639.1 DNA mismatch repair protein MSH3 [Parastagonospora nodorum]KAH5196045.1 DNA mismatch repair protein MSH3 [Parastagonospora nodorum]KAH5378843.1 DNA mismatch repair protein MSH3 [Parastagonospora nodorum]